jgi:hypothetical protein
MLRSFQQPKNNLSTNLIRYKGNLLILAVPMGIGEIPGKVNHPVKAA